MAQVSHLFRHPIKGHGVEAVSQVILAAGKTFPWDRVWAIADAAAHIEPGTTQWARCINFSRGAKSPELMAIRATVDEGSHAITLCHPRLQSITVDPDQREGAARLIAWVQAITEPDRARPSFIVRAEGRGMTDSDFPSISVLSRASLKALEHRLGRPLAMERFRGNVWLDGLEPWQEFAWIGGTIQVGGATLSVRERITRCTATTVSTDTGLADADTLGGLRSGWGHQDFGVYAEVVAGGTVAVGDAAGWPDVQKP